MEKQEQNKTVVAVAKAYSEVNNDAAKKKIIESCGVKTYLPIKEKISVIDNVVYNVLGQIDNDGLASYNAIDCMIYLILSMVESYTNLQMGDELEDFDALMSSGLMDMIIEAIGEDSDVFKTMFESVLDEFVKEHNTLSAYVSVIVKAILEPLSEWSDAFTGFINENGGIENVLKTIQDLQEQLS